MSNIILFNAESFISRTFSFFFLLIKKTIAAKKKNDSFHLLVYDVWDFLLVFHIVRVCVRLCLRSFSFICVTVGLSFSFHSYNWSTSLQSNSREVRTLIMNVRLRVDRICIGLYLFSL